METPSKPSQLIDLTIKDGVGVVNVIPQEMLAQGTPVVMSQSKQELITTLPYGANGGIPAGAVSSKAMMADGSVSNIYLLNGKAYSGGKLMTEDPKFQNAVIQTAGGYYQIKDGKGVLVSGYDFGQPPKPTVPVTVIPPVQPPVPAPIVPVIVQPTIPKTIIQQQGVLQMGDQGEPVKELQMKLNALNLSINFEVFGYFGKKTRDAVEEYQQSRNLLIPGKNADPRAKTLPGVVDKLTLNWIDAELKGKPLPAYPTIPVDPATPVAPVGNLLDDIGPMVKSFMEGMGDAIEDNAGALKGAASSVKKGINYILSHSPGETFDTITKKLGKALDDGGQLAKDLMNFALKVGKKGTPENALMHQVVDQIAGASNTEKAKMAGYVVTDLAIAVLITKGAGQLNKLVKSGELANLATKTIKAMDKIKDVMNKHADQIFEKVKSIANMGDTYEVVTPDGLRFKISKSEIDSQNVKKIDKMIEGTGKVIFKVSDEVLDHADLGDFNSVGRMTNGGHGQSNIDHLVKNNIEFNIVKQYANGVRVGNVPSHKNKFKQTGTGQAWFPSTWSRNDIKNAGEYVANLAENLEKGDGVWMFAEYKGVRVGIIKSNGNIGTIVPDNSLQP